ncbi:MAG: DMT family transporter [Hyphomicrobiales bacterium]
MLSLKRASNSRGGIKPLPSLGPIVALTFGGAVPIISPEAATKTMGLIGDVLGILSGLAYVLSLVVMKYLERWRLREDREADHLRSEMAFFNLGALLTMLAASFAGGENLGFVSRDEFWLMVGHGVRIQFLGWFLIVKAAKQVDATLVGLILLLEPVPALLFNGISGFGHPTAIQFLAAALVLVCVTCGTVIKSRMGQEFRDNGGNVWFSPALDGDGTTLKPGPIFARQAISHSINASDDMKAPVELGDGARARTGTEQETKLLPGAARLPSRTP